MRKKAQSQRHKCPRQNCCGASNQHENFLSITDRNHTRSQSKKKVKKSKKKDSTIKQILKQTYDRLKQENQQLLKKLTQKKKKIDDLKNRLKDCEQQIKIYQQLQRKWTQGNQIKIQKHKKSIRQQKEQKKYTQIIQDSQQVAKQTLERYRKLQDEFAKYKQNAEKKIDKLRSQKQKLTTQSAQNNYNRQIQQLKIQLNRFKQDQITAASLKNLHHHQHISANHEQKLKMQVSSLKVSVSTLKSQNTQLKQYVKQLEEELEDRTNNAQSKQKQLKRNLDIINDKINNWQKDYRKLKQESSNWQQQYNSLLQKYKRKKQRHKINNAEWAEIFKQFIHEIDKLKQQLDYVSQRNVKLIKMYGQS